MESDFNIINGDCLDVLKTIESESVQCCVTSPPYFGLRDYGTADWEGGDAECDHKAPQVWAADSGDLGERGHVLNANEVKAMRRHGPNCTKCGAVRIDRQIGLEATPALFVAKMVEVFDEVRRVLQPDGTLWLNLGDSYASNWPCNRRNVVGSGSLENGKRESRPPRGIGSGIKDKDLIGIPWRVAFALQEAGWWLRQDIIWAKPNPMPESVTDRCTKAHEYIFLLTKSQKYYYDNEAIKEPCVYDDPRMYNEFEPARPERGFVGSATRGGGPLNKANRDRSLPRNRNGITGSLDEFDGVTRNKRSVWTVTTQPYSEAHFATFPPKLIEPCILAGSREGDIVLDPFNGSGTTGLVSLRHRRRYIGIELNPEYIELSKRRLAEIQVKLF